MQQPPLVSIIIPTYNRAHLIGETLDSVLAQTYQNWECIVVDDGSTDDTDKVMAFYCEKDSRIQYHHRPQDRLSGGNAARNYGFEMSKGEYVNWFDDDDIMCNNKLHSQVEVLNHCNYNFSICQVLVFEGGVNNILGLRHEHIISEHPLLDFIKGEIVFLTPSLIIKKSFLIKNNLRFSEDLKAAQEWEFFTRILFYSPEYHITNESLVKIRKHNQSISFNDDNNLRNWHYYLAREKLFLFLSDKVVRHDQEINDFLSFYFKSRLKKYLFEKKVKESWTIFNNTIVFLYSSPKVFTLKLYIHFVLLTGRGYNFYNRIIY